MLVKILLRIKNYNLLVVLEEKGGVGGEQEHYWDTASLNHSCLDFVAIHHSIIVIRTCPLVTMNVHNLMAV